QVLTLVEEIKKKLPTLVLKLKNTIEDQLKGKSIKEQEDDVLQNIDSFCDMILENMKEFKELVLSARPSLDTASEPNYEERKAAYRKLLKLGKALMVKMEITINTVFDKYKECLDNVWKEIRAGNDSTSILDKFHHETEAYLKQSWDPLFTEVKKMEEDINDLKNSNQNKQQT
ncbi:unnamed protein product, partial [Rotaria sp. Silwood2]